MNAGAAPVRRSRASLPSEVLLSMACYLRWGLGDDVVPRDAPPVSFPVLVQSHQEQSVVRVI